MAAVGVAQATQKHGVAVDARQFDFQNVHGLLGFVGKHVKAGRFHGQLRLLKHALGVIKLKLEFDDVAVSHFSATLQILADLKRAGRLIHALLRSRIFSLRRHQTVILVSDGNRESAPGHFGLGLCESFRGRCAAVRGE